MRAFVQGNRQPMCEATQFTGHIARVPRNHSVQLQFLFLFLSFALLSFLFMALPSHAETSRDLASDHTVENQSPIAASNATLESSAF